MLYLDSKMKISVLEWRDRQWLIDCHIHGSNFLMFPTPSHACAYPLLSFSLFLFHCVSFPPCFSCASSTVFLFLPVSPVRLSISRLVFLSCARVRSLSFSRSVLRCLSCSEWFYFVFSRVFCFSCLFSVPLLLMRTLWTQYPLTVAGATVYGTPKTWKKLHTSVLRTMPRPCALWHAGGRYCILIDVAFITS